MTYAMEDFNVVFISVRILDPEIFHGSWAGDWAHTTSVLTAESQNAERHVIPHQNKNLTFLSLKLKQTIFKY
jgi:hypothetical protein